MVRLARVDDADGIAEVHVRSWQVTYRGHMPDSFLDSLSVEKRAAMWRAVTQKADDAIFVAEDDSGRVVGFCSLSKSRDAGAGLSTGEISAIYVLPDSWGRGLGQNLMEAAIDEGRKRQYLQVTLWVLEQNQRARRFYEAFGFECDGATKEDSRWGDFTIQEVRYRLSDIRQSL